MRSRIFSLWSRRWTNWATSMLSTVTVGSSWSEGFALLRSASLSYASLNFVLLRLSTEAHAAAVRSAISGSPRQHSSMGATVFCLFVKSCG